MEIKRTAMQMMLMDLEYKQRIYEETGMFECATALVTSIELAKSLIKIEKAQILEALNYDCYRNEYPENYYEERYGN